jgi:hypothetical protein
MVVLSASELPPETLCAGGTIEYYDSAFVCGDPNGFRRAVVTRNDDRAEVDFPVALDTMDVIPGDVMMKRGIDACGKHDPHASLWRKLRTYQLDAGTFAAATKSSALKKALAEAVTAAVESAREALRDPREKIVPEPPPEQHMQLPGPDDWVRRRAGTQCSEQHDFGASGRRRSFPHVQRRRCKRGKVQEVIRVQLSGSRVRVGRRDGAQRSRQRDFSPSDQRRSFPHVSAKCSTPVEFRAVVRGRNCGPRVLSREPGAAGGCRR